MYHLTPEALTHRLRVRYFQVAILCSLSFPLVFPICPKHVSDAYKAATELPQIAARGFMENPTSYFSLNMPGHELPLHSLCLVNSSPKSSCPVHDHRGLRWSQTGIWQEVCILLVLAALSFAFSATLVITKQLLSYLSESKRGFFIYMLIEFLPKGVLQLHVATGWITP